MLSREEFIASTQLPITTAAEIRDGTPKVLMSSKDHFPFHMNFMPRKWPKGEGERESD